MDDDESALNREENQPCSVGNGWYFQEIDEEDKENAIKTCGACTERRKPRKTPSDGND